MTKKSRIEGTLIGCRLMQEIWHGLSQDEKERHRRSIQETPRMYPCPEERFWFVVKEDECRYCKHAIMK